MSSGIPYVPLDCQLDEKFDYIEAEFGLIGFAVVVKLFQRIYGGHGYYCEWNDRVALLFAHKIGAGGDAVREVVSAAIREGIFDKGMYQKFGILTSHGIQRRFAEVAKRRKLIFDKPEYVLICCEQISEDVDISGENVNISGENVCNSNTSKGSKVKEVNVMEGKESAARSGSSLPQNERALLVKKFGEQTVSVYEKKYKGWCSRKKVRATESMMYQTIAKWIEQDGVREQGGGSFDVDEIVSELVKGYSKEVLE